MSNFAISIVLITLGILQLFTLGDYGVIDLLYSYGKPVDAVMVLTFVPLIIVVMGFVLLLIEVKK